MRTEVTAVQLTSSRGRYLIKGIVNGVPLVVHTTDAEVYDYFNDDSDPEKHEDAIQHCVFKLEDLYELMEC